MESTIAELRLNPLQVELLKLVERPIGMEDVLAIKTLIANYFKEKEKREFLPIEDIRLRYPNEWVLLGNPKMENAQIMGGVVVYHSPDKRDLVKGRAALTGYDLSTWTFTGTLPEGRRVWLGIYRSIPKTETETL